MARVLLVEVGGGEARLDGVLVPTPANSTLQQQRDAALRAAVAVAAQAGTALEVHARDPEGVWRLLAHPNGQVDPMDADAGEERSAAAAGDSAPEQWLPAIREIVAAGWAGQADQAAGLADALVKEIEAAAGQGADWVRALELRAHLAYLRRDWAAAASGWLEVARQWLRLGAAECWTAARNAHHCWVLLTLWGEVDVAVSLAGELEALWRSAGRADLARVVLRQSDRLQLGL